MATQPLNAKGQLASSAAAIVTANTGQTIQLNKIDLFNESGGDVANIKFYIVPSAGSASAANSFYLIGSLTDNSSRNIPLSGHILEPGDTLQAVAGTGSAVNYVVSYTLIT